MSSRRFRSSLLAALALAVACGKPVDPSGKEDASFVKASMGVPTPTGEDRPLAAELAVEPVSMLVMFNRLKTPDKLQEALNKKPGQFSHLDLDKDNAPDPLTVAAKETSDGHAFEIRARPTSGEYVVATMVFDKEWTFLGHYSGVMGGAASTFARPLLAAPLTGAPSPSPAQPTPVASNSAPVADPAAPTASPGPNSAGAVQALPAGSEQPAGLAASP